MFRIHVQRFCCFSLFRSPDACSSVFYFYHHSGLMIEKGAGTSVAKTWPVFSGSVLSSDTSPPCSLNETDFLLFHGSVFRGEAFDHPHSWTLSQMRSDEIKVLWLTHFVLCKKYFGLRTDESRDENMRTVLDVLHLCLSIYSFSCFGVVFFTVESWKIWNTEKPEC